MRSNDPRWWWIAESQRRSLLPFQVIYSDRRLSVGVLGIFAAGALVFMLAMYFGEKNVRENMAEESARSKKLNEEWRRHLKRVDAERKAIGLPIIDR